MRFIHNLRTAHRRPTSRECAQLCVPIPLWRQLIKRLSFPKHLVSSIRTGPVATPNPLAVAFRITVEPVIQYDNAAVLTYFRAECTS